MRAIIKFWLVCLVSLVCTASLGWIGVWQISGDLWFVTLALGTYLSGVMSAFFYRGEEPPRVPRGITTALGMVGLGVGAAFAVPLTPWANFTHEVRQGACLAVPFSIFHALSYEFTRFLIARPKPGSS